MSLSEKINPFIKGDDEGVLMPRDVKEFIKELKEEVERLHDCKKNECAFEEDIQDTIDKIFGEKLI